LFFFINVSITLVQDSFQVFNGKIQEVFNGKSDNDCIRFQLLSSCWGSVKLAVISFDLR